MAHQQSQTELKQHLNEHIEFLKLSAQSFDNGFEAEAKRLAVSLRVLLHDTPQSASLLGQLTLKNQFWDSALPEDAGSVLSHSGLVVQVLSTTEGARHQAYLDELPVATCAGFVPFDGWWRDPVLVDQQGREISRKDLVLWIANKDGGAHVDPQLNATYADLSRNNSLGWVQESTSGSRPVRAAELAAVRQIAHEVLKTLEPGYAMLPKYRQTDSMVMGAVSLTLEPAGSQPLAKQPVRARGKIGRNDPCPCGTGKKWKKCHGA